MSGEWRTVWKVTLDPRLPSPQRHALPLGFRVVAVTQDPGYPHVVAVYAEVSPDDEPHVYAFGLTGTGRPIPDVGWDYLGTAICPPFAWHAWIIEPSAAPAVTE